ncbi:hypothetical protein J1N35_035875 [Gossypium stocksii]|uniref:Uncharacterized protein n=1 Tax=Gossypium stocksii TaxID=47602 RepID=A0A9D3UUW0_9ROSI|nr:hypothetical protein J1N35_035875 [Gossypium stocksii]
MFTLYCLSGNVNAKPVQLFAELADVKPVQNVTSLGQQYGIHPEVIGIDANDLNNDGHSHHEDEDFSNPDLDKVPNDIDDKGTNESENVHAPLAGNLSHCIVIRNDLWLTC